MAKKMNKKLCEYAGVKEGQENETEEYWREQLESVKRATLGR